jgi:starvation-inducible DNA-binding protein
MDKLIEKMKVVLASASTLYLKSQFCHWNVTGPNFPQLHDLFGKQYDEIWNSLDATAEAIRTLKSFAPGSYARLTKLSRIKSVSTVPESKAMVSILTQDHETLIELLKDALKEAEKVNNQGIMNHLGDRIEAHEKHAWMLRSTATTDIDMSEDLQVVLKNAGILKEYGSQMDRLARIAHDQLHGRTMDGHRIPGWGMDGTPNEAKPMPSLPSVITDSNGGVTITAQGKSITIPAEHVNMIIKALTDAA